MIVQNPFKPRGLLKDLLKEATIEARYRIDPLMGHPYILRKTAKRLGYEPDLQNPTTYNEKILWRKLRDRRAVLTTVSDKIAVRDFVSARVKDHDPEALFPKLYATASDPAQIHFATLPDTYVVKSNYGSGRNILVTPDDPVDVPKLLEQARLWQRRSYGKTKFEWAYQSIKRQIMVEELISDDSGRVADDIKFAVFDGKCEFIVYCDDRFGDYCWHHLTPSWDRLFSTPPSATERPLPPKPNGFDEMLKMAEQLCKGIDYFRVDFMITPSRFVLNEITLYDASGMDPLDPPIWDKRFGEFWTLPS